MGSALDLKTSFYSLEVAQLGFKFARWLQTALDSCPCFICKLDQEKLVIWVLYTKQAAKSLIVN